MWVKLEKSNKEESEPLEFSYLPAATVIQQSGKILYEPPPPSPPLRYVYGQQRTFFHVRAEVFIFFEVLLALSELT